MSYDVYYATGGGSMVYGGSDVWVNNWLKEVAPHLDHPSKLLIHRRRPENIKVKYDSPIPIVWQGYNPREFEETLSGARKIHILHGYYRPHSLLMKNKDKIESICIHVSLELSLTAGVVLGVPKLLHYTAEPKWESQVASWAKKRIWIGINPTPLHDKFDMIDIPNYYEFTQNNKTSMNNRVGYAARMETRKSPHLLDGVDSIAFTDVNDWNKWKKDAGYLMNHTKLFQFNHKNLHRFFNREDWGISHSCHLHEPFGYSIFQALDYGKLPILQKDWCKEYNYPFRAFDKKEFDTQIGNVSELSEGERNAYLNGLRDFCRKYDNKQQWVEKYLEIYND